MLRCLAGRVQRAHRGDPGGIAALLELIARHRGAFEYEWRTRFGLPLSVVGSKTMRWGEAWRLTLLLLRDPSSFVSAEVAGWNYPAARGELVLLDLYDLQHASKAKRKPLPRPRPWDRDKKTIGQGTSLTIGALRAVLDTNREAEADTDD